MIRSNVWAKRVCQAGLAVVVAAAPYMAAPFGWTVGANTAWAAEKQQALTEKEALAMANRWVSIPEGYKLRNAHMWNTGDGGSAWSFVWEQGDEARLLVEVDAGTGELRRYYRMGERPSPPSAARLTDKKGAEAAARQFLQQVAAQTVDELSEPNQFQPASDMDHYPFVFTRMVNNVPFLENGMYVTVDKWGRVVGFSREWWPDPLPEAEPALTLEEAEETLKQALQPSVVFANLDRWLGVIPYTALGYRPVYRYELGDAYALDAVSGEVLTRSGERAAEKAVIRPLGNTVRSAADATVRITVEEAQAIADQLAKRISGSYRSEGQGGSGMSAGPDGVQLHWSFDYRPADSSSTKDAGFELSISDRGELVEYVSAAHRELLFGEKPTEKPVSLAKAEEAAVAFVKRMLPERLGELYLKPLTEKEREMLTEQAKRGRYEIPFGWMKGGIPLENSRVVVTVEAETGEVIGYRDHDWGDDLARIDVPEKLVDPAAAVEAETKQKQLMLTYFLPDVVWGAHDEPLPREVRLVYRYVGSDGVVDAATGEWLDRNTLLENNLPRDIAGHPQEEAIRNAINRHLLTVTDGRVEPDKPLTRGELAFMASRAAYGLPIFETYRRNLYDDENLSVYSLTDVPASHPQYQAIQNAVAMGLLSPNGSRFEPDRPVTRLDVAQVAVKLLGYGDLLGKPELFASPFADIDKAEAPAAVLADSFGLVLATQSGQFAPDDTFTRAEAAQMFLQLEELIRQRK